MFNQLVKPTGEPNTTLFNPNKVEKPKPHPLQKEVDIHFLLANGYENPRQLEDGSWVAIMRLIFTWSVCVDIDVVSPYRYRYCFEDRKEAYDFLSKIKEFDEAPVGYSSLRGHRTTMEEYRLRSFDELGYARW